MDILKTIIIENELNEIKKELVGLHREYKSKINEAKKNLKEGVLDFDSNDLEYMFDEAKKRFLAAKRGVKIANKLNDPEQKSRVWSNLNKLRAFIKRLENQIEQSYQELMSQTRNTGTFDKTNPVVPNRQFSPRQDQSALPRRPLPQTSQQSFLRR